MFGSRRNRTLAIIGNGFDLNHGYKTDYKSFSERTHDPDLQKFKKYCDTDNINTWYLFEENIRTLTGKLFFKLGLEDYDAEDCRKEKEELARVFKRIHVILKDYLRREVSSKPVVKKPCIEKYLNDKTVAINFNYTDTVERYTSKVIYVHGSLKEDDIVLGYDFRAEPCLAQYDDMQWSKSILREALSFRRFLVKKKKCNPNSTKYKMFVSGLEQYYYSENTGLGIDDEVKRQIPKYKRINRFLKKFRRHHMIPDLCYKKFETLVVIGHGIEADQFFIKEIVEKCVNLKKIVFYRFDGENEDTFNRKLSFFAPYCSEIEIIDY